ncbi:CPBP family intramembrane glutamic endopeptidase [Vogesella indigofera]|uniref:CPBP family intramembrane glutamic endopeptidase n=1 Tax=Vogesella indigofera TaxID=45465 RepID=UPI00234FA7E5|nr:CPBP family intramembrane glutamic endopeptidase [Vogesella indigofera]MDC7701387.1 CPBP family intramembrane metalloprotease [Vogesella indigofera]
MPKFNLYPTQALIISLICFGLPTLTSLQIVSAGFPMLTLSDDSNAGMILIELILAATALLYLRAQGFDIADLYPRPSWRSTLAGLLLTVIAWLASGLITSGVASLTHIAGQHGMSRFSFAELSLVSIVCFAMINGTFEEVFLLGVLARGLHHQGPSLALGISLLVRMLYHLYQGPLGVVWVLTFGLTLSIAYLWKRTLWPPVLAHILWDIVPFFHQG